MATWEDHLDEASAALDAGNHHEALQLCDRAAMHGDEARYHAAILRGDVLLDLGDASGALSSYETAADPEIEDPDLDCARGIALFELGRLAEAENALKSAVRGQGELAEAYYALGLIAEIAGTGEEVEYFRRAKKLEPDRFPIRPQLPREAFEAVVEAALDELPPDIKQALEQIPVLVAELPHPDDLKHADPPLSPLALGMIVGVPSNTTGDAGEEIPAAHTAMVLFKRNLERAGADEAALQDEIRRTIVHEIGHALGYSEDELAAATT